MIKVHDCISSNSKSENPAYIMSAIKVCMCDHRVKFALSNLIK